MNLNIFSGKKPEVIPPLSVATERVARARQAHAQDADETAHARAALGHALLNEASPEVIAKARKAVAEAEVKESESAMTLAAAETVHKASQEAATEKERAERAQAIAAKQDERHANALEIDAAIDALAAVVQKGYAIHAGLSALNPPPSVPLPAGLSDDALLRMIGFRLRYRDGMTYTPFHNLDESRVAHYLPGAKPANQSTGK